MGTSGACRRVAGRHTGCTFPVIPAGETRTITITGLGVAKGTATNSVSVSSDESLLGFEPVSVNNTANETTTVCTRADVEVVSKVATPPTINLRDPVTYTVTIRNNAGPGLSEADDVVVSDSLPPNMRLTGTSSLAVVSGPVTTNSCTGAAGAVLSPARWVPSAAAAWSRSRCRSR